MRDRLRNLLAELSALERPSASAGEREAAERIAGELSAHGAPATVEEEQAHGGYWWPVGLLNAATAVAGALAGRGVPSGLKRTAAGGVGAFAAQALADDLGGGSLWFRRRFLPHRPTYNVVAEAGDPNGARTVVVVAHHDAAHSGLVFHPALGRSGVTLSDRSPPVLFGVWAGPAAVALGALFGLRPLLRAGAAVSAVAAALMADIGGRAVVPGANDNLSAVAVLVALAERLRERPVSGIRVLLVSTGSEESFSEGMRGFMRTHADELPRERTEIVCLECVGSPHLHVLEGEGMLRMRDYPRAARDDLARAAATAGVEVQRGWRTVAATDALIPLRAGYRVGTLAAVTDKMLPSNYHWPTDTHDNLDWGTIGDTIEVVDAHLRLQEAAAAV